MPIQPDTEIMQRYLGGQSSLKASKCMSSLSIQPEGVPAGLQRLLERNEDAIVELESQNVIDAASFPPRLLTELQHSQALHERLRSAMVNLTRSRGHCPGEADGRG